MNLNVLPPGLQAEQEGDLDWPALHTNNAETPLQFLATYPLPVFDGH